MNSRFDKLSYIGAGLLVSLVVFVLAGTSQVIGINAGQSEEYPVNNLPVVGSLENLQKLLQESQNYVSLRGKAMIDSAGAAPADQAQSLNKKEAAQDFSGTNTQVEGVDEADLVKTDGEYIYKVNSDRLLVIKAYPADKMQLVNTIVFDQDFTPAELFLHKNKLIIIGNTPISVYNPYNQQENIKSKRIYPYYETQSTTALIYDINDKNNPQKLRELELEGQYLSARKIDQTIYLVSRRYLDYYLIERGTGAAPAYRDSVQGADFIELPLSTVRYFPDCITPDYLTIAALDLDKADALVQVESYLGGGENIYASDRNLFIAFTINKFKTLEAQQKTEYYTDETRIYRFALDKGGFRYSGEGSVPGRILNQFSMDEYDENFRIATTTGDLWGEGENLSKNNLYILDNDLKIAGKLEGIAPGEKIYSTRFLGDRAFMVTFRKVDPFFVLDLHDPQNPQVLGNLKIPGYSDYLHPYDENHIIGFGKDTVEVKNENGSSQAYYQGLKVSLFDVTDVTNPVEMSKVIIGDRGTDSELLNDHKALLFSKAKNLLAFPVTVMEKQPQNENNQSVTDYGTFTFQGAYIYQIDLQYGFQLKGKITHLAPEEYDLAGDHWYNSDKNVQRILYLGDTLYTISEGMLKANNLSNLQEIGSIKLN